MPGGQGKDEAEGRGSCHNAGSHQAEGQRGTHHARGKLETGLECLWGTHSCPPDALQVPCKS